MNAWLSTLRIRTLPAGAAPVLMGATWAHYLGVFSLWPAMAALVGALLLQIGTNLANDYYDHIKGADTPERAGPTRASASGLLSPIAVRNAAFLTFLLAALVGVYLITIAGWPILVIGIAGILSGIFYTAGPKAIAYVGLGELFVFAFFGPIAVAGTVFVQSGTWETTAALWGIASGLLSAAILIVNNLRDIPTDAKANKRTLAVRMGEKGSRILYSLCLVGALAIPFVVGHLYQDLRLLAPAAAGLVAIAPLRMVWTDHVNRAALNPALGKTAGVLLAFALLLLVSLI